MCHCVHCALSSPAPTTKKTNVIFVNRTLLPLKLSFFLFVSGGQEIRFMLHCFFVFILFCLGLGIIKHTFVCVSNFYCCKFVNKIIFAKCCCFFVRFFFFNLDLSRYISVMSGTRHMKIFLCVSTLCICEQFMNLIKSTLFIFIFIDVQK